jgi:nucleotide-binding universal stress UspA family protein
MLAIKNVLVATDFSKCSEVALNYGRALARQFGARLHVMHAVEPIPVDAISAGGFATAIPELQANLESAERAQLEELLTEDDRRTLRATTVLASFATPAPAIVGYAETEQVDLIVVGTHGRRGFSHLLMGSVAEKVVRTAPCPVLTVRNPEREFIVAEANAHLANAST